MKRAQRRAATRELQRSRSAPAGELSSAEILTLLQRHFEMRGPPSAKDLGGKVLVAREIAGCIHIECVPLEVFPPARFPGLHAPLADDAIQVIALGAGDGLRVRLGFTFINALGGCA